MATQTNNTRFTDAELVKQNVEFRRILNDTLTPIHAVVRGFLVRIRAVRQMEKALSRMNRNYVITTEKGKKKRKPPPSVRKARQSKADLPCFWVRSDQIFEDELWEGKWCTISGDLIVEGAINDTTKRQHLWDEGDDETRNDRGSRITHTCKCSKTKEQHDAMDDEKWLKHRREVNRYRRNDMNERAERKWGKEACPFTRYTTDGKVIALVYGGKGCHKKVERTVIGDIPLDEETSGSEEISLDEE